MAGKNNKVYYVRVALSIAEEKAYDREMNAFLGLNDLNKKIIITNDDIDYSTGIVKHLELKDFLLGGDLD